MGIPRTALLLPSLCLALLALGSCRNLERDSEPSAYLEGSVHHLERLALPPGAELVVRLVEPGPSGAPGARGGPLAELHRADIGQSPFAFRLGYDARRVQPGRVLRLEAEIRVGNEVWFQGARTVAGLHRGPPAEAVELRVHRR